MDTQQLAALLDAFHRKHERSGEPVIGILAGRHLRDTGFAAGADRHRHAEPSAWRPSSSGRGYAQASCRNRSRDRLQSSHGGCPRRRRLRSAPTGTPVSTGANPCSGSFCMVSGVPTICMMITGTPAAAAASSAPSPQSPPTSLMMPAPAAGPPHHLAMACVDGKDGVLGLQAGNRRQHPRQFLVPGDRLGTRACRFPAYVDDRRSGGNHLAAGGNGACRRVVAAPIRKTVGGDIQDAHDPGWSMASPAKGRAAR